MEEQTRSHAGGLPLPGYLVAAALVLVFVDTGFICSGLCSARRGFGVAMSRPARGCQNRRMETAEFIDVLRREGLLLADAAGQARLTAKVPPCPGWQVRDLVRHQGVVHRWAARFVTEGRTDAARMEEDAPEDGVLLSWFREGHARLVDGLAAAPPDLDCWYFLPAPSPLAFWARRQAHETTVHRVDAEAALGKDLTPIGTAFASDGVDELLTGFHVRAKSRVRSDRPRSLRVRAVDAPAGQGDWLMHLTADPLRTERAGMGPADCTVRGTAAELYLALWNRGPYEGLEVSGDTSLVELWQRTAAVI